MENAQLVKAMRSESKKGWTGRLVATDPTTGTSAAIYMYEGGVYSVQVADFTPHLTNRLVAAGILDEARIRELGASVEKSKRDDEVGRFAITRDWLPVDSLAAFHAEYLLAGLGAALALPKSKVQVDAHETTDRLCTRPTSVDDLLTAIELRETRSQRIWNGVAPASTTRETVLRVVNADAEICLASSEVSAFIRAVDGINTVDEIACSCGFTRAEAIVITAALISGGAVAIAGRKAVHGVHVPEDFATNNH
ncbi:MAG: hypothetical protein ACR2JS_05145 [Candidatus Nanopelagicales bacterium]